jgi:hypothetical protein
MGMRMAISVWPPGKWPATMARAKLSPSSGAG